MKRVRGGKVNLPREQTRGWFPRLRGRGRNGSRNNILTLLFFRFTRGSVINRAQLYEQLTHLLFVVDVHFSWEKSKLQYIHHYTVMPSIILREMSHIGLEVIGLSKIPKPMVKLQLIFSAVNNGHCVKGRNIIKTIKRIKNVLKNRCGMP